MWPAASRWPRACCSSSGRTRSTSRPEGRARAGISATGSPFDSSIERVVARCPDSMNKTVCLAVGFQILAMAACETPVAEQGHPCPCAPQWTCCSANLCVPDGTSCPAADSGASPVASDLDANTIDSSADLDAEEYSTSPCKPGVYQGSFTGSYSSHLVLGMPLAVSGNVDLTLDQEGTANQMCTIMVQGEGVITEHCNDVFT